MVSMDQTEEAWKYWQREKEKEEETEKEEEEKTDEPPFVRVESMPIVASSLPFSVAWLVSLVRLLVA